MKRWSDRPRSVPARKFVGQDLPAVPSQHREKAGGPLDHFVQASTTRRVATGQPTTPSTNNTPSDPEVNTGPSLKGCAAAESSVDHK